MQSRISKIHPLKRKVRQSMVKFLKGLGMSISQYSFRSGDWSSYLIDIQRSVEHGTSTYVSTSHEASGAIQASISDLQTDLNWALMLVMDRLGEQTTLLAHVVARLEAIHRTLDSPLLTQARELFRIGVDRFNRRLYEKALESFLQAEEKDDVYFPLHLQLGFLYLRGMNEEVSLYDPIKAEKHFLLAARYAAAYRDSIPEAQKCVGEAHFYGAQAIYLQAQREKSAGSPSQVSTCLAHALDQTDKALEAQPGLKNAAYLRSKILALTGKKQAAIKELERLVDRDRRYLGEAARDGDFDSIRGELAALSQTILDAPGPISRQACHSLQQISEARHRAASADLHRDDLAKLDVIGKQITSISTNLNRMDTDVEKLIQELLETGRFLRQRVSTTVL